MPDVPTISRPPVIRVAPQRASERLQTLADSPVYVKGLIYGDPGVGKTYLACTAPNPILILSDYMVAKPTLQALRKLRGIDPPLFIVNTVADFEEAYNYAANLPMVNNPEGIPSIIIDSLTDLNDRVMEEVLADGIKRPSHSPDQLEVGDWNKVANKMFYWVRRFRDLPMHTIMTALVRESKDGLTKGPMAQPNAVYSKLPAFFNLVGYLNAEIRPKQPSIRRLQVDSSNVYVAKNPGNALASVVENPDLAVMIPAIVDFLKGEVEVEVGDTQG
jgi:hypothetical protein